MGPKIDLELQNWCDCYRRYKYMHMAEIFNQSIKRLTIIFVDQGNPASMLNKAALCNLINNIAGGGGVNTMI